MKAERQFLSPEAMNASGLNPVEMITTRSPKVGEITIIVKFDAERLFGFI